MAKAKDTPMSTNPAPTCRTRVGPTVDEWRTALAKVVALLDDTPPGERRTAEADVCLTSRSAYLDYFTWVVIRGSGDEGVERDIDTLFRQSLEVLTDRKLKGSVGERYDDFQHLQERARTGRSSQQLASSLSG